jgi:pectinesterase
VFKNCHIHSKKNSHVTAASTPREIPFGFVFLSCKLTADTNVNKVSLGRPWQPNASVAYVHCELGNHIIPEGWHNWKNPDNEKTARFAEFENYGPGANTASRVSWSKQLTKEDSEKYNVENILGEWGKELINKNKNSKGY